MDQLNLHTNLPLSPPPIEREDNFPLITHLKDAYKLWHGYLRYLPRNTRFTLGEKIDTLFTQLLAGILTAKYGQREEKISLLRTASVQLDHLKYFITILWELRALDTPKYTALAEKLSLVGKMLGGLLKKTA